MSKKTNNVTEQCVDFLPIGTEVTILSNLSPQLTGTITCVKIQGQEHRVNYEVTWWSGVTTKSCDWFEPYQLSVTKEYKPALGFCRVN